MSNDRPEMGGRHGGPVLDEPTTQAEFGRLVGISQQAVSALLRRGVLRPGETGAQWLRAYCQALERAAEADPKELTAARTELAMVRAEGARDRLSEAQGMLAPTDLLRRAAVAYAAQVARAWASMGPRIRQVPGATPSVIAYVDQRIEEAAALADGVGAEFDRAVADHLADRSSRRRGRAEDAGD